MGSTIREGGTQHWAGIALSLSNKRWLERARGAALKRDWSSGRRTFITELASKGVSVRVLAELAGHSSIQTTQRYIDVNPQQMTAAVELL